MRVSWWETVRRLQLVERPVHRGCGPDRPPPSLSQDIKPMADSIKGKAEEIGHKVAEAAQKAGHAVAENAEAAADWVKQKAHQAGNRAEEAAEATGNRVKEAGQAIKDKGGA